jgi:competence protein ComEA
LRATRACFHVTLGRWNSRWAGRRPSDVEMPEISRRRALAYVAVLVLALAVGGRLVLDDGEGTVGAAAAARPGAITAEAPEPRRVVVHVVGAVRHPGLYELEEGSRIDDAIEKAGGAKPRAALELVNLASPVADGQQVLVPGASGKGGAAAAAGAGGGAAAGAPGQRVHLNTATLEQLDALPGVGPVTAQKILDYRTENGAFSSVDELDAVPGIGPARLEQLRELVDL